ncbi:MAG: VWA domain-containing protein [Cyanobacteriota bacterium]|nr:VWA domain-containing protein [Cyanobacteriota bacterium]
MDREGNLKHLRRWRLILGPDQTEASTEGAGIESADAQGADAQGAGRPDASVSLTETEQAIDAAMEAVYESERSGDLGRSSPRVARWLGEVRTYFPTSIARILQQDALDRLDLYHLLLEPEILETVEPDVRLVADLLSLHRGMSPTQRQSLRQVVEEVVAALQEQLAHPLASAVRGARRKTHRNRRPRHRELDWERTIRANLKHYLPQYRTLVPVTRIGRTPSKSSLPEIVLCIDRSGSMATSVVYASIFAAVLASLDSLKTYLVGFDTSIVDLTDRLQDPVEVLLGMQLGGGTDIDRALACCQGLIDAPRETILVLISDLYEGGNSDAMLARVARLCEIGVRLVVLLALNDEGAPDFDRQNAQHLADLGIPTFACTPDRFPEVMAAALDGRDLRE